MLSMRVRHTALFLGLLVSPRTHAAVPPLIGAGTAAAQTPVPPLTSAQTATKPGQSGSRLVAGLVLGAGVAAIAGGTFIALKYQHSVAGSQEDNLYGLGIACAGVPLAMLGTMLWFNVPGTASQVALGRSGFAIGGRF